MNTSEATILLKRLKAAWPNIYADRDTDRQELYLEVLVKYSFFDAQVAINRMISEMKHYPSVADLYEALRYSGGDSQDYSVSNCSRCENTGWIFVDNEGHGSVQECGCGHPYGGFTQKNDIPKGYTSDGSKVATRQEKYEALVRGFRRYRPEATSEEIQEHLGRFGLKIKLDFVDVDSEPF